TVVLPDPAGACRRIDRRGSVAYSRARSSAAAAAPAAPELATTARAPIAAAPAVPVASAPAPEAATTASAPIAPGAAPAMSVSAALPAADAAASAALPPFRRTLSLITALRPIRRDRGRAVGRHVASSGAHAIRNPANARDMTVIAGAGLRIHNSAACHEISSKLLDPS